MIAQPNRDQTPLERAQRMDAALQRCFRDVVAKHKREGLPVVIWRDGRVQHVDAADLERELDADDSEAHEKSP